MLSINEDLYDAHRKFVIAGHKDSSTEPAILTLQDFLLQTQQLRSSDPVEFTIRSQAWMMGREEYQRRMDAIIDSVVEEIIGDTLPEPGRYDE